MKTQKSFIILCVVFALVLVLDFVYAGLTLSRFFLISGGKAMPDSSLEGIGTAVTVINSAFAGYIAAYFLVRFKKRKG